MFDCNILINIYVYIQINECKEGRKEGRKEQFMIVEGRKGRRKGGR